MVGREQPVQAEGSAGAKHGGRKMPLCLGEGRQTGWLEYSVPQEGLVGREKGEVGVEGPS